MRTPSYPNPREAETLRGEKREVGVGGYKVLEEEEGDEEEEDEEDLELGEADEAEHPVDGPSEEPRVVPPPPGPDPLLPHLSRSIGRSAADSSSATTESETDRLDRICSRPARGSGGRRYRISGRSTAWAVPEGRPRSPIGRSLVGCALPRRWRGGAGLLGGGTTRERNRGLRRLEPANSNRGVSEGQEVVWP